MTPSRVDEVGPAVLAALDGGATVAEAAVLGEIPEDTLRTWIKRGRRAPESRFGEFARTVDAARRLPEYDPTAPLPTREELLARLAEQARAGSVRACEVLLKLIPPESEVPLAPEPFAETDQLAERRQVRSERTFTRVT